MKKQRKRLAAVLISSTLVLSSLASIIPQGTVMAAEDGVQGEQEAGSWEPIPEEPQQEAPAPEPMQEEAPAVEAPAAEPAAAPAVEAPAAESAVEAPAETAAPAAQTIDNAAVPAPVVPSTDAAQPQADPAPAAVPAADPSAALAAGMQAVPAADGTLAEGTALTDAEEVIVPSETTGETAVQDGLITVIYASGEGGSVSAESETVNLSEGGQAAGAQAAAYDGYVFTNWTAADGTVVSSSDYFVPVLTPDMTGEITYTAHFEKKAVEAPATRMVTAEYVAGKGGSVSRASETVDALAEGAAFLGSTAEAADGYAFVNWTAADGSEAGTDAAFVPSVSPETAERTVYTANFKKINTRPAQDFEGSVSGVSVRVHADEGRFPEGTTMHLAPVSRSSILSNDSVQDAVGEDREVVDAIAVDITFRNKNGDEIEPDGAISVSMSTSRSVSGESHQVLHIDDSGNASQVAGASADGASFEAGEFSIYVITGIDTSEQEPKIATYIFYGADGKVISTQKVKDGETVYAPTTPEKAGSKFIGWSYEKDATELQDGDPGVVDKFNATVSSTEEVKLYPVFQQAYYVFFMDDQGRVSTTKEGVSGNVISVEDVVIPLDSTQSVTGWYTEAELTNKVESVTLSNHNVTLYPKVETGHYLYFASGDGATYVKPVFVAANAGTAAPETPTRPGYTFKHWSASEGGAEYKFGNTIAEDTTLHAVWKANRDTKYTVIYWWENANDSNYSYHENSVETGTTGNKIDLTGISRSYDGFTLNTEKTDAANADAVIAGDGSTIVNVYYSRNIYEIKFFKAEREWWVYSWSEMEGLRISAKYGANISNRWPTSTSKIWGTKQGDNGQGTSPYQSGISTMPLDGASFYYVEQSGSFTMNLHYNLEGLDGKYSLHHTDSFKSDDYSWKTTKEDHYDIEGFTYTNNVKDGAKFEKESQYVYKVSFKYSRNSYSINFVNGDFNSSKTYKYEADISEDLITAPARPSGISSEYTFVGWFDNELGVGEPVKHLGKMPAHNITLYAKWAAPTYTGTVHLNIEGTGTPMRITIDYGGTINENDMPTVKDAEGKVIREGTSTYTVNVPANHTWAGWATKSGDDFIIYNFNEKIFGDITLYPYYINGEKYKVTYSLGEGSGTAPTDSKQYAENSYADIQPAAGVTPPGGKTFLYWSHGTDKYYPGDKVKITGNLELTAVYGETSPLTSITYHSNYPEGSELKEETTTVDKQANNTAITLEKAGFTAPTGYYFAYWKDASGKRYDVGTNIGIDNDNTSANDLYAVWEQKKEITLTANSGEFTYDGTEHTVSGVKANTFTIDQVTYTVSGFTTENPKETNAGTYTNNILNTDSIVVKNGDADVTDQFTVNTENGSLKITPKEVTVTADSKGKTYGAADPELTATVSGTLGNDTVRYTLSRAEGENVGDYTITPRGDEKQGNYTVTYETGTFTISKSGSLVLTADGYEGVYDGKSHAASASASVTEGTTISYQVGNGAWTTEAPSIKDVGEQKVNVKAENANYKTASTTVTLKVTPKAVTVTAENKSKTYGEKDPELTAQVSGTLGNDTVSYTLSRAEGEAVGTYTITPSGEANQGNYKVSYKTGTFTISESGSLVLTADGYEGVYDGKSHAASASASVTEGTTISYQVGNGAWTTEAPSIKDVGEQKVNVKAENANYKTASTTVTLKVTPKAVTVTAENKSKTYGEKDPELTAQVSGTLGNDTVSYTLSRAEGEAVGTYTITPSGDEKQGNYKVSYETGIFTISKSGTLTLTANGYEGEYDGEAHAASASASVTEGTTISYQVGNGAWTTEAPSIKNVGEQTVSVKAENANYETAETTVTLKVTPKAVTVTADSKSKTYGEKDPELTATVSKMVGKDAVDYSLSRAEGENVGDYVITPKGDKDQGNYTVTYVPGKLTISKAGAAGLNLSATGYDGEYDGNSHAVSASASVTEGTTISYQVGNEAWTTEAPSIKDVGDQTVTVKAENANYETASTTVTLKVTPRKVTITSGSGSWTYDSNTHSVEKATAEGFVGSDGAECSNFATITEKGKTDNTFDYTLTKGTKRDNYKIEKKYGTLEITAADEVHITITGNTETQTYNGKEKTVSGFTTIDLPAGITVSLKTDMKAEAKGTNAGEYPMGLTEDSFEVGGTENYKKVTITVNDGTLTINKRKVTLTSDSATKEYDETPLTAKNVTVSGDGFADGEYAEYDVTGIQIEVGQSENTFTYRVIKGASQPAKANFLDKLVDFLLPKMDVSAATSGDPADNYDITVVYGTLTVTQKSEPEPKPDQKPDQKPEGGGGGGSATGERAVAIYKVDEQTGAYLAGAQFALYDSTGKLIGTYETNEQGFLKASYLSNGSYYFVETKAPDGYAISQNRINFYLDQSRSYSNDYPWNIKVTNRRMQAVAAVQTPQAPAVTPAPAATVTNSKVPATGDESRMQFYGWLALFAAAAMSGWFVVDKKRRGRK